MLVKNAEALELMEKIDTLVVDKTGTLTLGKPKLVAVVPAGGFDEDEVLRLAAALERGSEHPLAAAIVDGRARSAASTLPASTRLRLAHRQGRHRHGRGPRRSRSATRRCWRSSASIRRRSRRRPTSMRAEGQGVMFVAVDGQLAGLVVGRRSDQGQRRRGRSPRCAATACGVVMLTGDNRRTAEAVARKVGGIDEVMADVLPEQKQAVVEQLQQRRAAAWRWPATASTTRRRSPPPMSASRWAPAPTWRWKAPR